ncbi:hypothetical protein [Shinella zoogloeoides]|uniref:DUF1834 family protein n=1 Tax=Shinella zoogloeoides TaxID=352475 RepID=A0A6N8TA37_SHIZO|nr:hypothetical protein [Shinella zoogloeoides]MXN99440.1 hypothetical protein [Shinella zoogloeoides]UEX82781.1 hypothetical protein K8M09_05745 [Shinella zoogloeoides]
MIDPKPFAELLETDPLAPLQAAIVSSLKLLNPGVTVVPHPGKVDVSELISRTVVNAPGIGLGWSKVKTGQHAEGMFYLVVEWVAYIVAEAKVVGARRVEKEAVGLAIGGRLLEILADLETSLWGRSGVLPPETTPPAELKPLFTIRDAAQGVAYYTVTWTQIVPALGTGFMPPHAGRYDEQLGAIVYPDADMIDELAPWIPAEREADEDA